MGTRIHIKIHDKGFPKTANFSVDLVQTREKGLNVYKEMCGVRARSARQSRISLQTS